MQSKIYRAEYQKKLKKRITSEISRGVSQAMRYSDITGNLNNVSQIGLRKASRIVRTEGHRIQQASSYDAQLAAKDAGADIFKQWDATLDGATRDTHRKLDGQIVAIDEPFEVEGMQAMYPSDFGDPSEDCNCRCVSLQRARWELDELELATLKERAEYFGLGKEKAKSFDDFSTKYLNSLEKVGKSDTIKINDTQIFRSVGAMARNHEILDPASGEIFKFSEGTKIQNSEVFAGNGVKKPLRNEVAEGLANEFGGDARKWQHAKGIGVINYNGEDIKAEVHWFQEESVGKVKFKVKEWLYD